MKVNMEQLKDEKPKHKLTMLQRVLYTFAAVTFLIGISALGYPYISDYINNLHTSRMYSDYMETMRNMDNSKIEEMMDEAREFNQGLLYNSSRWLPDGIDRDRYLSILDTTGTGIIGYVEVPDIDVRLPVYHTTEESVLQIAVGHMEGSSFPIGEKGSHAILSGHNGLISASIFTELEKLNTGDKFYVTVLGNRLEYVVDEINVVLPDDFNYFDIDPDKDYVTLVTCTPFGVNSHRLLVRGERVDYSLEENRIKIRFE